MYKQGAARFNRIVLYRRAAQYCWCCAGSATNKFQPVKRRVKTLYSIIQSWKTSAIISYDEFDVNFGKPIRRWCMHTIVVRQVNYVVRECDLSPIGVEPSSQKRVLDSHWKSSNNQPIRRKYTLLPMPTEQASQSDQRMRLNVDDGRVVTINTL